MEIPLNDLIKTALEKMQQDSALTETEKSKIFERIENSVFTQKGGDTE